MVFKWFIDEVVVFVTHYFLHTTGMSGTYES